MVAKSTETSKAQRSKRRRAARQPAYFLSVEVENVRCFGPPQKLDLSNQAGRPARWTVILGDNGVGKTTLLQALGGLEAVVSTDAAAQDDWAAISNWKAIPRLARDEDIIFPRFGRRSGSSGPAFSAEAAVGSRLETPSKKFHLLRHSFALHPASVGPKRSVQLSETSVNPYEALGELQCYGYGANRRMGMTSLSLPEFDDHSETLFSDDASLVNAEEWLLLADYSAARNSSRKTHLDKIKTLLIEILPDVTDIRIRDTKRKSQAPVVEFLTPYGWIDLWSLGLGYRSFIGWIVDFAVRLLYRYPRHKDPLAEPAIVLIDEIDLHLHPKWQRQIMSYLSERFPNTQFIATAHSPLIAQSAVDSNIAVLRREGDHVVIDNNPTSVQGWRIDQVLTSDLFGLASARPPTVDEWMGQRDRILAKKRITKKDRETLKNLEEKMAEVPGGESQHDMEAMQIIREAARHLNKSKN